MSEFRRLSDVVLVLADGAGASRVDDFGVSEEGLRVTAEWADESLQKKKELLSQKARSKLP